MNIPHVALGLGFTNRPITISKPVVHAVNVSNGMPIVRSKRVLHEKPRNNLKQVNSCAKIEWSGGKTA